MHSGGHLSARLNIKSSKVEGLPTLISFGDRNHLSLKPFRTSFMIETLMTIMCCEWTASNISRLNGAFLLLEQKLERKFFSWFWRSYSKKKIIKSLSCINLLLERITVKWANYLWYFWRGEKILIKLPAAMHPAKWMARAVHS